MAAKKNTVELKAGVNSAGFMADGKWVELDEKNPTFATDDENLHGSLLELPFLKATGKQDS